MDEHPVTFLVISLCCDHEVPYGHLLQVLPGLVGGPPCYLELY